MSPRPSRPSLLGAVVSLTLAAALAACGPTPGATGPAGSPGGSGDAACATSPAPPDNLEGWGMPPQTPTVIPVIINTAGTVTCGSNRMLFTLQDSQGTPVGAPDRTASIAFYDLGADPKQPVAQSEGTFVWAIEGAVGIYVANISFPTAGRYGAEVTTAAGGAAPEVIRLTLDVQPDSPLVGVGDPAPASKTPTLADVGGDVAKLSTDKTPEPAFYQTSIDQALAAKKPFVVIFATPKFCRTGQCGPTLDRVKPFVARYPTVTFINVEPYELKFENGSLQPVLDANNDLEPVAATAEWHLFNEPTVYVVNREGVVTANFDLIFSDAELTAALDGVK